MKTRNKGAGLLGIAWAVPAITVVFWQPVHGTAPDEIIKESVPRKVGRGESHRSADAVIPREHIKAATSAPQFAGPKTEADNSSGTTAVPVSVPGAVVIRGDNPEARDCTPSAKPGLGELSTPSGNVAYTTNRYLPVKIKDNDGVGRLIRVEAVQLPAPFKGTVFEGYQWWVGQPVHVSPDDHGPLFCDPDLAVPIQIGTCQGGGCLGGFADGRGCSRDEDCQVLYLEHEGILPSLSNRNAVYEVRVISEDCDKTDPNNFSDPLTITQDRLGDVTGLAVQCPPPSAGNGPGGEDINAILKAFASAFCSLKRVRCDITRIGGGPTDHRCDLVDINQVLEGFTNPTTLPWGPVNPADPCHMGLEASALRQQQKGTTSVGD